MLVFVSSKSLYDVLEQNMGEDTRSEQVGNAAKEKLDDDDIGVTLSIAHLLNKKQLKFRILMRGPCSGASAV